MVRLPHLYLSLYHCPHLYMWSDYPANTPHCVTVLTCICGQITPPIPPTVSLSSPVYVVRLPRQYPPLYHCPHLYMWSDYPANDPHCVTVLTSICGQITPPIPPHCITVLTCICGQITPPIPPTLTLCVSVIRLTTYTSHCVTVLTSVCGQITPQCIIPSPQYFHLQCLVFLHHSLHSVHIFL